MSRKIVSDSPDDFPQLPTNLSVRTSFEVKAALGEIAAALAKRGYRWGDRTKPTAEGVVGSVLLGMLDWCRKDPDGLARWLGPHYAALVDDAKGDPTGMVPSEYRPPKTPA